MAIRKDPESYGECIFCLSKCPECRSTNVEIRYLPEYTLVNEKKNSFEVEQTGSNVNMICDDCGETFCSPNEKMDRLLLVLDQHLAVATHRIEIDNHGEIGTTQEIVVSKKACNLSPKKAK